MTEVRTEGLDLVEEIIKKNPPQFEVFRDSKGKEFFKKIYRNEKGTIVYVTPGLTLYPLPKEVKDNEQIS